VVRPHPVTRPGAQADPVRPLRVPAVGPPPCPRRLHGGGGCAREPQLAQELLHVQEVRQGWQEPRRPPAPRKDDVNNASCLRVSNEELQSRVKREHERRNHMAQKNTGWLNSVGGKKHTGHGGGGVSSRCEGTGAPSPPPILARAGAGATPGHRERDRRPRLRRHRRLGR